MTEDEFRKGIRNTLIILFIFIIMIVSLGIYVFANRENSKTVFTSIEAKESYEKVEDTTVEKVEQITDQNQIDQILNTNLETEQ